MRTEIYQGFEFNVRTLGGYEAKIILSLEARGTSVIDVNCAAELLGGHKQAQLALLRLEKKGWLERVSKGRYVLHPSKTGHLDARVVSPLKVAANILPDSYIGWWAAASHHGLTWQYPMLIRVAATKQSHSRHFEETQIEFVKISQRKFFGFDENREGGFKVSSVSKTAVDCADKPKLAGGFAETAIIVGNACERVGVQDVVDVALKMGSKSTMQRLGFFIESTVPHLFDEETERRLRHAIGEASFITIGSDDRTSGDFGVVSKWRLRANINERSFRGEVDRFGTL